MKNQKSRIQKLETEKKNIKMRMKNNERRKFYLCN